MTVAVLPEAASAIHKHLKSAKKVMIIPHQNPDGDAIGSATAFYEYLTGMKKPAVIFCATKPSDKLNFVPRGTSVRSDPEVFQDPAIDTVVTLDSGDLRYAGVADFLEGRPFTIINIDHHASNEHFGHHNLVITTAASTTEILFHYFRHNSIHISQQMATSLLTGIATDTSNFTNANTSSTALSAGGELILSGGNFNLINDSTLKNKSVSTLKLWGRVLSRLQKVEHPELTHTFITQADMKEAGAGPSEREGIANFLNNLENSPVVLILAETEDGKIKGSFRTTSDNVDVSALAKKFNGGGHKKAAGFSSDGTVDEVLQRVLTLL